MILIKSKIKSKKDKMILIKSKIKSKKDKNDFNKK